MLGRIAEVYHRYGFDALESSAVETVEALGKFLPDVDRPSLPRRTPQRGPCPSRDPGGRGARGVDEGVIDVGGHAACAQLFHQRETTMNGASAGSRP